MKIKNLKIGVVMALTLAFMGAPMIKASATQETSDNTTLNINQNEDTTETENEDTTGTEDLTAYGFPEEEFIEDFAAYFAEDEDLTEDEDFYETEYTNFTADQSQFEVTYDDEEYINFLKKDFKEKLGTENTFKTIYEDECVKEEVNPATTEVKTTNKENGEVESYNYFKRLDQRLMNEEESIKFMQEQAQEAKENFQEKYGTENEFKVVSEDENTVTEVNGYTGEYRTRDKRTRSVTETQNYFEELKKEVESVDERF